MTCCRSLLQYHRACYRYLLSRVINQAYDRHWASADICCKRSKYVPKWFIHMILTEDADRRRGRWLLIVDTLFSILWERLKWLSPEMKTENQSYAKYRNVNENARMHYDFNDFTLTTISVMRLHGCDAVSSFYLGLVIHHFMIEGAFSNISALFVALIGFMSRKPLTESTSFEITDTHAQA